MGSKKFLGLGQAKCTPCLIGVPLTMHQELCPKIKDGRTREILDVDIPVAVKACADHEPRVVVEQYLSRIVERADIRYRLASKTDRFAGQARKDRPDLFLMPDGRPVCAPPANCS